MASLFLPRSSHAATLQACRSMPYSGPIVKRAGRLSNAPIAVRQPIAQGKGTANQHRASWNRAHRHGYTRTPLAPPPAMPFCHTHHRLDLRQASAWGTPDAMPHTPPGLGKPGSRTATRHAGVPEARLPYIQECFAAKRSTRPAAELAAQRSNIRVSLSKSQHVLFYQKTRQKSTRNLQRWCISFRRRMTRQRCAAGQPAVRQLPQQSEA